MTTAPQQIEMYRVEPTDPNVDWFVGFLARRDWTTAAEILRLAEIEDTDNKRRWLRALANASSGRIAGGQKGYKLIAEMRSEEYQHWRNWMNRQAEEMQRRVVEADREFYKRTPVQSALGI